MRLSTAGENESKREWKIGKRKRGGGRMEGRRKEVDPDKKNEEARNAVGRALEGIYCRSFYQRGPPFTIYTTANYQVGALFGTCDFCIHTRQSVITDLNCQYRC